MIPEITEEFWQRMERFTGALTDSDRRWFWLLLSDAASTKRRMTRSRAKQTLDGLKEGTTRTGGRGRPRKTTALPSRLKWAMMGKEGDDAVQAAQDWLANEPASPPRMDWQRYFLISTLASAWGRRLSKASGKSLSFARDAHADSPPPTGPFFEAVKLCLHHLGRSDSDEAIAEAIRTARDRIFAL